MDPMDTMEPLEPWSKLELVMLYHHMTQLDEYDRLVAYLSRTETPESIREARSKVNDYLREHDMEHLTESEIEHMRSPESPCSLEQTGWAHLT